MRQIHFLAPFSDVYLGDGRSSARGESKRVYMHADRHARTLGAADVGVSH